MKNKIRSDKWAELQQAFKRLRKINRIIITAIIGLLPIAAILYIFGYFPFRGSLQDANAAPLAQHLGANNGTVYLPLVAHLVTLTPLPTSTPEPTVTPTPGTINGPLHVSTDNFRYFADKDNNIVYLTGSHTWSNLQDNGIGFPPPVFNYTAYLDFLANHNHNFFRLWAWEQSRWTLETFNNTYWFNPMPYQRTGSTNALDGKPKFDLTKFNQAYFDRMRARVQQAYNRGMYVSIMLFDGWSVADIKGDSSKNHPWLGHPFNASNNINSINGDPNHHNDGLSTQDGTISAITAIQKNYVKKVIDTVNDLDNVLYEIDNEGDSSSVNWQYDMINYIHTYEATLPHQHPVGMTAPYPGAWLPDLFTGPADWISPDNGYTDYLFYQDNSPSIVNNPFNYNGQNYQKVVITDTDHECGICYDHTWVWKSFTRGMNVLYMDGYDGLATGVGAADYDKNNTELPFIRSSMGYARSYANRMNLKKAVPHGELSSTSYCLANPSASGAEFLVYAPSGGTFSVNLTGVGGSVQVEWFNPLTGHTTTATAVSGGASRNFTPPFSGEAVLYLHN